jgi:protein-export membrane protein SecD
MDKGLRWRIAAVVLVLFLGVYFLIPTYKIYFGMTRDEFDKLEPSKQEDYLKKSIQLGLDLQGGMDLLLQLDRAKLPNAGRDADIDGIRERALGVLRNRVDEFGVREPVIQRTGEDRILVQLAGLKDPVSARRIIQRVAKLEFRLVKSADEMSRVLRRVDRMLAMHRAGLGAGADTAAVDSLAMEHPLLSRQFPISTREVAFAVDDVPALTSELEEANVDSLLPNVSLLWDKDEMRLPDGRMGRVLWVIDEKIQLTGEGISRAYVRVNPDTGTPDVVMRFDARSAAKFAQVTGAYVGELLAIVLDDRVASAPRIRERISGGEARIEGNFTDKEASELKVVLEAGALPVPLTILEERTVGPSLGRDSIRQGTRAALVGALLVGAFMLIYYRASGALAVLALLLNVFFLFAALATFGATLTLPGIAGIVLTAGMAVDANVLIFERIREELRVGKTVRAAIDAGYSRAFRAIFDSNLTTLISSLVLWQFGTGPIRGFAVTLTIGLIANLFTAVFVTRVIYDAIGSRRRLATLSI